MSQFSNLLNNIKITSFTKKTKKKKQKKIKQTKRKDNLSLKEQFILFILCKLFSFFVTKFFKVTQFILVNIIFFLSSIITYFTIFDKYFFSFNLFFHFTIYYCDLPKVTVYTVMYFLYYI